MQHQNRLMKAGFRTLLLQIQNMHKEHQKYAALHGEVWGMKNILFWQESDLNTEKCDAF